MPPKLTVFEIGFLQDFTRALRAEAEPSVVHTKLSFLLAHYDVINWQLKYDWPIWRARRCSTAAGFESINDVIYPLPHRTPAGRLNDPHEPMLYGVFNKNTCLEEVGAEEGDFIHLVGFRLKKNTQMRCCVIGEIDRVHRSGRTMLSEELGAHLLRIIQEELPYEAAISFVFIDAFLSSLLRDPLAERTGYLHSRTVRKLLFQKQPDLEAICYSSVKMEGALNIAITPEAANNRLDLAGTSVIRIDRKFDYGLFDFSLVRNAADIRHDRHIIWS
jgi:RES domain